jgi:O-antigen ligase
VTTALTARLFPPADAERPHDPDSPPVGPAETVLAGALLLLLGGALVAGKEYGLALQGLGCLLAMFRLALEPGSLSRALSRIDPFVLALLTLLVLSTGWSADPSLTVRRVAGVLAASAFGLYLADRYSLTDQLLLVMRALTVAALVSAAAAVVLPRYGVSAGAWRGVFLTKNVLARLMTLGVLASLLAMSSFRDQRVLLRHAAVCGLVCAGVLLQADSAFATLVLAVVVALVALTALVGQAGYPIRQAAVVAAVTATAATATLAALNTDAVLRMLDKGSGLTGRRPLWSSIMPAIREHLWLGHGYGAFWQGWEQPSYLVWLQNPWGPPHAHNGVLELALNVGVVGVVLWLLALLSCLRRGLILTRVDRVAYWPVGLVLLTLAFNVTEVTLMSNALFWALFVAVSSSVFATQSAWPIRAPHDRARTTQTGTTAQMGGVG